MASYENPSESVFVPRESTGPAVSTNIKARMAIATIPTVKHEDKNGTCPVGSLSKIQGSHREVPRLTTHRLSRQQLVGTQQPPFQQLLVLNPGTRTRNLIELPLGSKMNSMDAWMSPTGSSILALVSTRVRNG